MEVGYMVKGGARENISSEIIPNGSILKKGLAGKAVLAAAFFVCRSISPSSAALSWVGM